MQNIKDTYKSNKTESLPGKRNKFTNLEKDRLRKLTEVARLLTSSLETSTVVQTIIETIPQVIPTADACVLMLYDKSLEILIPVAWVGFISENIQRLRLKPGESMSGYSFQNNLAMLYAGDQQIRQGLDNMSPSNRILQTELTPEVAKSVMCAPLDFKGRAVGIITVNNFTSSTAFSEFDLELLQSLASQASISIENSRLYEEQRKSLDELAQLNSIIRHQHQQLEHALYIHRTLSGLVLQNRGLNVITQALADILKQPVAVLDSLMNLLSQALPASFAAPPKDWELQLDEVQETLKPGRTIRINTWERKETLQGVESEKKLVPIQAGNDRLGYIFTSRLMNNSNEELAAVAIEQAATIIALELVKEQTIFEVERRLRGEFLEEILEGSIDENILGRASLLGYDNNCDYWIILADIDDFRGYIQKYRLEESEIAIFKRQLLKFITQLVTFQYSKSIITVRSDMVVVMLGIPRNLSSEQARERANQLAQEISKQLATEFKLLSFSLALSRPCPELRQFKARYQEALLALQIFGSTSERIRGKVLDCASLGSALLLLKLENKAELFEFVNGVLGQLIKYDQQHHSNLLNTLKIFSKCNCDHHATALELHVHSNTLSYRLNRIEEITGRKLNRTDDWLDFQLALRLILIYPAQWNSQNINS